MLPLHGTIINIRDIQILNIPLQTILSNLVFSTWEEDMYLLNKNTQKEDSHKHLGIHLTQHILIIA
jgi:hypothetical protein